MMVHLNSFSASGVGNLNKNFPKIQMPGGLPGGGGCLSFDLTDTIDIYNLLQPLVDTAFRGNLISPKLVL